MFGLNKIIPVESDYKFLNHRNGAKIQIVIPILKDVSWNTNRRW